MNIRKHYAILDAHEDDRADQGALSHLGFAGRPPAICSLNYPPEGGFCVSDPRPGSAGMVLLRITAPPTRSLRAATCCYLATLDEPGEEHRA